MKIYVVNYFYKSIYFLLSSIRHVVLRERGHIHEYYFNFSFYATFPCMFIETFLYFYKFQVL